MFGDKIKVCDGNNCDAHDKCMTCKHNPSNIDLEDESYLDGNYKTIDSIKCKTTRPHWSLWEHM
jgi:hypothetical protein